MASIYHSRLLLLLPLSALLLLFGPAPEAVSAVASIKQLPGFPGPLPFDLETGYVMVDEASDSQLFYYFIKSERNPAEDPLILWLTGGPGCSGLSGLAFEIGPFGFKIVEYNDSLPRLIPKPYSWTKIANIIFLDAPVGTGFSFSSHPKNYMIGDTNSSHHMYIFLKKWFNEHPEFLSNRLYIAGDSYGGKMTLIIMNIISEGIQARHYPPLNLQGYLIGNPMIDLSVLDKAAISFAHGAGIISYELYKSITKRCENDDYTNPIMDSCKKELNKFADLKSKVKTAQILEPLCDDITYVKNEFEERRYMNEVSLGLKQSFTLSDPKCREYEYYLGQEWANFDISRMALHVQKGTKRRWIRCDLTRPYSQDIDNAATIKSIIAFLAKKGYRSLVYSGDLDIMASFLGTDESIRSFNWSIVDDWRAWTVDGQTAGFTRTYSSNLTFATVKGAGHTAPEYKRKECFSMLSRWISGEPL